MQSQHLGDDDEGGGKLLPKEKQSIPIDWQLADIPAESDYNDGKGIWFALTFTPLPPPPKAGTKRRANGKKKAVSVIFYMHEVSEMYDMLCEAMAVVKRQDIPFTVTPSGKLETLAFEVTYSIPRGAKDITLSSEQDYVEMISQAKKKPGFSAEVKLSIEEVKVCHLLLIPIK
jgi:hypothetical protein